MVFWMDNRWTFYTRQYFHVIVNYLINRSVKGHQSTFVPVFLFLVVTITQWQGRPRPLQILPHFNFEILERPVDSQLSHLSVHHNILCVLTFFLPGVLTQVGIHCPYIRVRHFIHPSQQYIFSPTKPIHEDEEKTLLHYNIYHHSQLAGYKYINMKIIKCFPFHWQQFANIYVDKIEASQIYNN
jgi:hypothetical protein